jgi:hypothetical protein
MTGYREINNTTLSYVPYATHPGALVVYLTINAGSQRIRRGNAINRRIPNM